MKCKKAELGHFAPRYDMGLVQIIFYSSFCLRTLHIIFDNEFDELSRSFFTATIKTKLKEY